MGISSDGPNSNAFVNPNQIFKNTQVIATAIVSDSDQDEVSLCAQWGDGTSNCGNPVSSGSLSQVVKPNGYSDSGNYTITLTANDEEETISGPMTIGIIVENRPPYQPTGLSPCSGTQDIYLTLQWSNTGDPDGDNLNFTVMLNNQSVYSGPNSSYSVSLDYSNSYEWYVIAFDGEAQTQSNSCYFSTDDEDTPPTCASNLSPDNNATNVSINTNLDWSHGNDPDGGSVTYDVYLEAGDSSPDNLVCNNISQSYCNLGSLDYNTQYFWKVTTTDDEGTTCTSTTFYFTTEMADPITWNAWKYGDPFYYVDGETDLGCDCYGTTHCINIGDDHAGNEEPGESHWDFDIPFNPSDVTILNVNIMIYGEFCATNGSGDDSFCPNNDNWIQYYLCNNSYEAIVYLHQQDGSWTDGIEALDYNNNSYWNISVNQSLFSEIFSNGQIRPIIWSPFDFDVYRVYVEITYQP